MIFYFLVELLKFQSTEREKNTRIARQSTVVTSQAFSALFLYSYASACLGHQVRDLVTWAWNNYQPSNHYILY